MPASYDGSPTPLVVDLHGHLSGAQMQTRISGLGTLADSAGFVLATPQGNGDMPYWNATPEPSLPDGVRSVSDVIHEVSSTVCIDQARVYVDGFSNGAFLASLIACRLADQVAAVATVSGLLYPAGCAPSRPVPILAIHGTADTGSTVQLYVVDGGGHTWPGSQFSKASEPLLGRTTFELDASATIWALFQEHPMPR